MSDPPKVPTIRSWRSAVARLPWLKMMTPAAPAASALTALSPKGQVPRWSSAMVPAVKSAKSAASHPLVLAFPSPSWRSTGVTAAVTSPAPLPVNGPVGYVASTGLSCWRVEGPT